MRRSRTASLDLRRRDADTAAAAGCR
jgi:hypothetical protein